MSMRIGTSSSKFQDRRSQIAAQRLWWPPVGTFVEPMSFVSHYPPTSEASLVFHLMSFYFALMFESNLHRPKYDLFVSKIR